MTGMKPLVKNGLEAPLVKKKEKRFIPVHVVVLLCWIATSLGLTVHSALRMRDEKNLQAEILAEEKDKPQFLVVGGITDASLVIGITTALCILLLIPQVSLTCHCFLKMIQVCGLCWLMYLIEKNQLFFSDECASGYFGFAIVSGITVHQISEPINGEWMSQAICTTLSLATAIVGLISTYRFSSYWSLDWSQCPVFLGTLFQSGTAVLAMTSLAKQKASGNANDDLRFSAVARVVGLCVLLFVIVPSTNGGNNAAQLAAVTTSVLVYGSETAVVLFVHRRETPESSPAFV